MGDIAQLPLSVPAGANVPVLLADLPSTLAERAAAQAVVMLEPLDWVLFSAAVLFPVLVVVLVLVLRRVTIRRHPEIVARSVEPRRAFRRR